MAAAQQRVDRARGTDVAKVARTAAPPARQPRGPHVGHGPPARAAPPAHLDRCSSSRVGAVVGWILYSHILDFLEHPYCAVPSKYRFTQNDGEAACSIYHGVLDGFTTRLKVSVIAGAVLTAPFWLYQIWAFVTPGLRKNERKYTIIFVVASTVLFAAGMALAYLVLAKGLQIVHRAGRLRNRPLS